MIKKIITIICIIAILCALASVDFIKDLTPVTKHFDELEINFEATDHTASIVESKDYVFYAATDGVYRKDKNSGDLCTRIVKGETTALQIFSNTLYYVIEETKLCSVDFDGKNFNEVYVNDAFNNTLPDYLVINGGIVFVNEENNIYYDLNSKKTKSIYPKNHTKANAFDIDSNIFYYADEHMPNRVFLEHIPSMEDYLYDSFPKAMFSNTKSIFAYKEYVFCLSNSELYKIRWDGYQEKIVSFSSENIKAIKKVGDYLYVMFEKHAERIGLADGTEYSEFLGNTQGYDGGAFAVADDKVYYKTDKGFSHTERDINTDIKGSMFEYYEVSGGWQPSEYAWPLEEEIIISKNKITSQEEFVKFAKEKIYKDGQYLERVVHYELQNYWSFYLEDTGIVESVLKGETNRYDWWGGGAQYIFDGNTGKLVEWWLNE